MRRLPLIPEPADRSGDDLALGQVRQRRITPQRQRLHEGGGCRGRVAHVELSLALRDEVGELVDVELARTHRHHVAALLAVPGCPAARRSDAVEPRGAVT